MSHLYVKVLQTRGVFSPLISSFAGALTIGMLSLSVLLLVRSQTGSLAQAGLATGLLGFGNALGVIVQGTAIDRKGPSVVLIVASVACTTALLVLALFGSRGLVLSGPLAAVAGFSIPATPSAMRSLWPSLISDEGLRTSAYALQAVAFTGAHVGAPVLVSGILLISGPQSSVEVAGGFAGCAGVGFALTTAARHCRPDKARRGWLPRGFSTSGMRTLLGATTGLGLAGGIAGVAIPAVALAHGQAAFSGILFAMAAVGDAAAGFFYGSRTWTNPLAQRLLLAETAGLAVGIIISLAALYSPSLWPFIPIMIMAGISGAFARVTASTLLDHVSEPGTLTACYSSTVSTGLIGGSFGSSLGRLRYAEPGTLHSRGRPQHRSSMALRT